MHPEFISDTALQQQIDAYFTLIEGKYHFEELPVKTTKGQPETTRQKVWDCEGQPATLSGLVLFLGFESRRDFDTYEATGKFAGTLKRGRLRVETEYEKKLHYQSPTGAIFALKSLGWMERADDRSSIHDAVAKLHIEIIESNYAPANSENEVIL
ncbi:MAG: hypothetical protein EOP47_19175 [Sphingobacteriaceae bacterium]|nr:MAG: hypothetical protein EOP47_19175 [Sphingobacteriaceae bacterium]